MVNVSILLLAVAVITLSVAVFLLGKRVSVLEKESACKISVDSLKAANRLQLFSLERYPDFVAGDDVNPFDRCSGSYSSVFPRLFAEDENPEL